jgi:hypothetical protein
MPESPYVDAAIPTWRCSVSIDDPGWGGDSFGGGSGGADGAGGGGWGSPDDKPPRRGLSWRSPAVLGGGALALVIIVVVVLVLGLHSSGKSKNTADVTVPTSKTSTSLSTSPTAAKPTPTKTVQTLASYDNQADAVCTTWKARVTAANNSVTTASQLKTVALPVLEGEITALRKIPAPSTELTEQKLWMTQIGTVLTNFSTANVSALNPSIATADTTAGNLGMKVCNYGY